MDQSDFLKCRVSEGLKRDFDEICRSLGETTSTRLRILAEQFVENHRDKLADRLVVQIFRPEDYQEGAWRVTMRLRSPEEMMFLHASIPFPLPELANRIFSIDPEYRAVYLDGNQVKLGGQFLNGEWRAHLYSNGIPESQNPTAIDQVEAALKKQVLRTIDKLKNSSR